MPTRDYRRDDLLTPERVVELIEKLSPEKRDAWRRKYQRLGVLPPSKDSALREGLEGVGSGLIQAVRGIGSTANELGLPGGEALDARARNLESSRQDVQAYEGYTPLDSFRDPAAFTRTAGQGIGTTIGGMAGTVAGAGLGALAGGPAGAATGAFYGGAAAMFGQEFGPTLEEYRRAMPHHEESDVVAMAALSSIAKAAVEQGFGPQAILSRGLQSFAGAAAKDAVADAAKNSLAKAGLWGWFKAAATGAAKGSMEGAVSEGGEEVVQLATDHIIKALGGAGAVDRPGVREYVENMVAGMVGGGVMGAPAGAFAATGERVQAMESDSRRRLRELIDARAKAREGSGDVIEAPAEVVQGQEQAQEPVQAAPQQPAPQVVPPPATPMPPPVAAQETDPFAPPAPADAIDTQSPADDARAAALGSTMDPVELDRELNHPLSNTADEINSAVIDGVSETGRVPEVPEMPEAPDTTGEEFAPPGPEVREVAIAPSTAPAMPSSAAPVPSAPETSDATLARFRPRKPVEFSKPYVGKTGAKLIGYQWHWTKEEYVDERGEERARAVSDWSDSVTNSETNRDVVHVFHVSTPDGGVREVSAETAARLLGIAESTVRQNAGKLLESEMKKQRDAEASARRTEAFDQDETGWHRRENDLASAASAVASSQFFGKHLRLPGPVRESDGKEHSHISDDHAISVAMGERGAKLNPPSAQGRDWQSKSFSFGELRKELKRQNDAEQQAPSQPAPAMRAQAADAPDTLTGEFAPPAPEVRAEERRQDAVPEPDPQPAPAQTPRDEAPRAMETPSFRNWRFRGGAAVNTGAIYPRRPGEKFTEDEIAEVVKWAEGGGLQVRFPSKTKIGVTDPEGRLLDLTKYSQTGASEEAYAAEKKAREDERRAREDEYRKEFDAKPSSAWVRKQFGDAMPWPSKIAVARFLEGEDANYSGLLGHGVGDVLREMGALSAPDEKGDSSIDWSVLKDAYERDKAPRVEEPSAPLPPQAPAADVQPPQAQPSQAARAQSQTPAPQSDIPTQEKTWEQRDSERVRGMMKTIPVPPRTEKEADALKRGSAKQLKVQKEYLLDELAKIEKEAPAEADDKEFKRVTIAVPDDGEFTIPYTKEGARTLRKNMALRKYLKPFSTQAWAPPGPPKPSMSSPTAPKGNAAKLTLKDAMEVAKKFTSDNESRLPLMSVNWNADARRLEASNGAAVIIIPEPEGHSWKLAKTVGNFPSNMIDQTRPAHNEHKHTVGAAEAWQKMRLAQAVLQGEDQSSPLVRLVIGTDGQIGVTAMLNNEAAYQSDNAIGGRVIAEASQTMVMDAIDALLKVGNKTIRVEWNDDQSPITFVGVDTGAAVWFMPMRQKDGSAPGAVEEEDIRPEDMAARARNVKAREAAAREAVARAEAAQAEEAKPQEPVEQSAAQKPPADVAAPVPVRKEQPAQAEAQEPAEPVQIPDNIKRTFDGYIDSLREMYDAMANLDGRYLWEYVAERANRDKMTDMLRRLRDDLDSITSTKNRKAIDDYIASRGGIPDIEGMIAKGEAWNVVESGEGKGHVATVKPQPAAPAPERTTPRKGTPERDAIESVYNAASERYEAASGKVKELRDAIERTGYGTSKRTIFERRLAKAEEESMAAYRDAEAKRKPSRQAWLEDEMESANPISRAHAAVKLGRMTWKESSAVIDAEVERVGLGMGATPEEISAMQQEARSYTGMTADNAIEILLARVRSVKLKEQAEEAINAMDMPEEDKARNLRRIYEASIWPDDIQSRLRLAQKDADEHAARKRNLEYARAKEKREKDEENRDLADWVVAARPEDREHWRTTEGSSIIGGGRPTLYSRKRDALDAVAKADNPALFDVVKRHNSWVVVPSKAGVAAWVEKHRTKKGDDVDGKAKDGEQNAAPAETPQLASAGQPAVDWFTANPGSTMRQFSRDAGSIPGAMQAAFAAIQAGALEASETPNDASDLGDDVRLWPAGQKPDAPARDLDAEMRNALMVTADSPESLRAHPEDIERFIDDAAKYGYTRAQAVEWLRGQKVSDRVRARLDEMGSDDAAGEGEGQAQTAAPAEAEAAPAPAEQGKIDDFGEKIGGARKDTATSGRSGTRRAEKKDDDGNAEPPWRKQYVILERVAGDGFVIGLAKRGMSFASPSQVFATEEEAERALPLFAVARSHAVREQEAGKYAIFKRVGKTKLLRVVQRSFDSREEAMKHMAINAVDLLNQRTSFGEEILPTPEIANRVGPARRTTDATREMFIETFAPRGIEFGNWNNQAERQMVMNHAYDGMLDLAEVLGVPPKALMLDGELAIAFGARGQGLSGARAHYETDYGVINLTKMHGAGSLAHEWFHALDHYLARQDTKASSERKPNARGDMTYPDQPPTYTMLSHGPSYKSKLRAELKEKYQALIQSMLKRAEKYVEDTNTAEKFIGNAKQYLRSRLDTVRRILSEDTSRYRKRFSAPASAEQLAEFDKLADMLVEGAVLDLKWVVSTSGRLAPSMQGHYSNTTLDAISDILQKVRGQSGFAKSYGVLNDVSAAMNAYKGRLDMLEKAKGGVESTRTVATNYAIEAKKMDQARSGDYWSEPHEMAARAFAAYVEDKIAERGGQSDFIVYHAHGGILLPMIDGFIARPYPEGSERKAINAMFDTLFSTIKTRTTDSGGVAMYRTAPAPAATAKRGVVTAEMDAEYMAAVERGDVDAAQKMVDEAAKMAGYGLGPVWHVGSDVYVFRESEDGELGRGVYLTGSEDYADMMQEVKPKAEKRHTLFAKITNPYRTRGSARIALGVASSSGIRTRLERQGYDGIIQDAFGKKNRQVVAFSPSQIKSADAITRDDAGRVIPLSERFNDASPDIRFRDGAATDGAAPTAPALSSLIRSASPADQARARETWRRIVGTDNISFVDRIFERGAERLGKYSRGWATIATGQGDINDTALHEAVHAAMDMLLTEEERAAVLAAAGGSEERAAEGFIAYANERARGGSVMAALRAGRIGAAARAAIEKLWRFVKRLGGVDGVTGKTGADALRAFYEGLAAGEYAKRGADAARVERAMGAAAAAYRGETGAEAAGAVSQAQDAEYMAAVERGDVDAAQKMVDEAAKRAGYTIGPVWHGTVGKKASEFPFNQFRTNQLGKLSKDAMEPLVGSFFTDDFRYAKGVSLYQAGLDRSKRPVVGRFYLRGDVVKTERARESSIGPVNEYIATDPSQIKSADPVTRDDQGRVIPLSERFNASSSDIRFRTASPDAARDASLSPSPTGPAPHTDTIRSVIAWVQSFITELRRKDKNARPDITKAQKLLSTIAHYSEEVPALRKIYEAALQLTDAKHRLGEYIFGPGEVRMADLRRFIRNNREAWSSKIQPYLWEADRDATGPAVRREGSKFVVYDAAGKVLGSADNEDAAWTMAHNAEAQELMADGWTAEEAGAVLIVREINDRAWDMLAADARAVERLYRQAGLPPPQVVLDEGQSIDLQQALREMGDRRGYYMPRLRKSGRYVLKARKDGANPLRMHFDTPAARAFRSANLRRQGYEVVFERNETPSEAAFLEARTAAIEDIINNALKRFGKDLDSGSLDIIGVKAGTESYTRKDGTSEKQLVLRGEFNEIHNRVFKDFGGRFYEGAWRFEPAKNLQRDLTQALLHVHYGRIMPLEGFAQSLAETVADVIRSRGSQSRKIGRREAVGEDVVVGYEEDALKAISMAGKATAGGMAKRDMVRKMMAAFTGHDESWDQFKARMASEQPSVKGQELWIAYDKQVKERRIDSATQPEAFSEGLEYIRDMSRNEEPSERVVGIVKGLAAMKYLSGVAPAMVNMTNLGVMVPAVLNGVGHIPMKRVPALVGRGLKRYWQFYMHANFGKGEALTGDDAWLFREIQRNGWDEQAMNREAIAAMQTWGQRTMAAITEKMMLPFAVTEKFNRASTIAAGYWGLLEKHDGDITASDRTRYLKQAKEMSDKAHGVYGKANLPALARGASLGAQVFRSGYVFKTFSHNFLAVLVEMGFKRRELPAVLTMMLAPAVMGGVGAIPLKDLGKVIAEVLVDMIPGYEPPDDIEEALYDAAEELFGSAGERTARAGLAGLAGFDLRGSLSIGVTDIPTTISDLLGAPWSVMTDLAGGASDIAKGDMLKGAEKLLPRVAAAPIKGYRESVYGVTSRNNQPVYYGNEQLRAGLVDAAIRAAGFSPARISTARDEIWNEKLAGRKYDDARGDIYRRIRSFWAQAPFDRDPLAWAAVLNDIQEYNARAAKATTEAVPFITPESIKRIVTVAARPPKREALRGQDTPKREPPAMPSDWRAYTGGSGGGLLGGR